MSSSEDIVRQFSGQIPGMSTGQNSVAKTYVDGELAIRDADISDVASSAAVALHTANTGVSAAGAAQTSANIAAGLAQAAQQSVDIAQTRINNILAHNGDGMKDTELIDARQPETGDAFPALGPRLNNFDAQLADIVYNVTSFGAVPGESDSTQKIQDAIDFISIHSPGSKLLFPNNTVFTLQTKNAAGTFLEWKPGVNFVGGGTIKVGSGVGDYRAVFEQSGDLQNVSMRDITIDANTPFNPLTAAPTGNSKIRTEIFLRAGKNITIDNIKVLNSVGIWSIITNEVEAMEITNCKLVNMGNTNFHYDTSAIYVAGKNSRIIGNRINAAGKGVTTAIEVHASNKIIADNFIDGYRIGIINAAVDETVDDSQNNQIIGNTITNVMTGISLWAISGMIKNIHIERNTMLINNLYFDAYGAEGIVLVDDSMFGIDGMYVDRNVIRFNTTMLFNPVNAPRNAGIGLFTTNIKNLFVTKNIIENSLQSSISIALSGTLSNSYISDNIILNTGLSSTSFYRMGVVLSNITYYQDVFIENNIIRDERSTKHLQYGVVCLTTSPTTDNSRYGLYIKDNLISGASDSSYSFANAPYVKAIINGWSRGSGIANAAYLSEIFDSDNGYIYTQKMVGAGGEWKLRAELSQNNKPTTLPFTAAYGDVIRNKNINLGAPLEWIFVGDWIVSTWQGYGVGAVTPVGTVVPYAEGEEYLDYVNKKWYKAVGVTNADWAVLN